MTAEELLESTPEADTYSGSDDMLTIDLELRTITIPPGIRNIGVESDEDVKRLYFRMPRMYGTYDLSEFSFRINYRNANQEGDIYLVEDKAVEGDNITFSWEIGRHAAKYKGNVQFIVCLKKADSAGAIQQEWNTTVATLPSLEGLEVEAAVPEETTDVIEQLLLMVEQRSAEAVRAVTAEGDQQVQAVAAEGTAQVSAVQEAAAEITTDRDQIAANKADIETLQSQVQGLLSILGGTGAGIHNSLFRGKDLGTAFTAAQSAAIVAGTFDDLYTGDYWTINNVVYRIAGFDIFLHTGDTELTKHHAVIVPDKNMYNAQINETNIATGGYYNSLMKQSNLATALATVKAAFGDSHILSRRVPLTNAVSGSNASEWAWYDSQIDLMTERQVCESPAWGQVAHNGYNADTQYSRFPLFTLAPEFITHRSWYWLQDVYSSADFCLVNSYGCANYGGASISGGVRPYFLIA